MPFRNNGWYYYGLVDYALKKGLITKKNIKFQLLSGLELSPPGYFKKVLETLMSLPAPYDKLGPNILIGCFNISSFTSVKSYYTKDFRQACTKFLSSEGQESAIHTIETVLGNLYQVLLTENFHQDQFSNIIYHLILDMEAMELHKMKDLIESQGGVCTYYLTDCIEYQTEKDKAIDISGVYWDEENEFPKYKHEKKDPTLL